DHDCPWSAGRTAARSRRNRPRAREPTRPSVRVLPSGFRDDVCIGLLDTIQCVDFRDHDVREGFLVGHADKTKNIRLTKTRMCLLYTGDLSQSFQYILRLAGFHLDQNIGLGRHHSLLWLAITAEGSPSAPGGAILAQQSSGGRRSYILAP